MSKQILWLSRHQLTDAQLKTLELAGYSQVYSKDMVFDHTNPDGLVFKINGIGQFDTIAMVGPVWSVLPLLRSGFSVIEFVNQSSSRRKGKFLCLGAYKHSISTSKWIDCPLTVDQQDEVDIDRS